MRRYLTYEYGFWVLVAVIVLGTATLSHHWHEEWQQAQIATLIAHQNQLAENQRWLLEHLMPAGK